MMTLKNFLSIQHVAGRDARRRRQNNALEEREIKARENK